MREYLELTEKVADKSLVPDFIRCDVTGKTQSEKDDVQAEMEAVMAGRFYQLERHLCSHDHYQHCLSELIKEVSL